MLWCARCVPIQALTYPALFLIYQTPAPLLHLSYSSLCVMVYPVCSYPGTDIPYPRPHIPDSCSCTPPLLLLCVMVYPVCSDPGTDIPCSLPHIPYPLSSTPPLLLFFVCSDPGTDIAFHLPHISDPFSSTRPLLPCVFRSR